ncbi:MAG: ATP-binding protein [Pseudohongiellaceae bacterium]
MLKRLLQKELPQLLREYPAVTVLGPRQSGKTTLVRTLRGYQYCNLELPENRELASDDPKAFLNNYRGKVIFDEIQRAPELLSYLQVRIDEENRNGQIILTGSHQPALRESISQSLAGRTAVLQLLPFSIVELTAGGICYDSFEEYAFTGFLPRIHDQQQRPRQAYSNYYQTYVERDVRQLINLKDDSLFEKFIKLLAGRTGQLMDYSLLANDVGVDAKTIRHWLSILEASFIVFKLPPYYENFGRRVIKSPKYYFTETGLLVYLLGIEKPEQIRRDPLVGAIFENLVVIECLKSQLNRGDNANLYFFRDSNGVEVDLLIPRGSELTAMEIKSSSTFRTGFLAPLKKLEKATGKLRQGIVVYNGESRELGSCYCAVKFDQLAKIPAHCGKISR